MQDSRGGDEEKLELCLKFANTLDWRTSSHASDTLGNYSDLVNWGRREGLIGVEESSRLLGVAENAEESDEALRRARALRETIYAIFSAVAHGKGAEEQSVETLNGYVGRALAKTRIEVAEDGYVLGWSKEEAPDMMLYPVVKSAAELLVSGSLSRVRECANEEEGCGSLFLDNSKSHSRRWCSMKSCGNKAKLRTYYERHARSSKKPLRATRSGT